MKKVAIITLFEDNYNYGAILQAYALRKVVNDNGYSCDLLRYKQNTSYNNKNSIYKTFAKKILEQNPAELISKACKLIEYKKNQKIFNKNMDKRKLLFHTFYENYLTLSQVFDRSSISDANEIYDIFICGSDQIWNPGWYEKAFFLEFANSNKGKIAYAPSIAIDALDEKHQKFMKPLVENLDFISVREQNGVKMISEITKKDVKLVLDPTLLVEKHEWDHLIEEKPLIQGKYAFCYILGNDKKQVDDISKWARRNDIRVVMIPSLVPDSIKIPSSFEKKYEIGPVEFLNLVKNADIILTDSFHGTIFSIIFQKKFYVIKRAINEGTKSMHSRLDSLLDLASCSDLIIDSSQLLENISDKIIEINNLNIERLKNESRDYLLKALLSCSNKA